MADVLRLLPEPQNTPIVGVAFIAPPPVHVNTLFVDVFDGVNIETLKHNPPMEAVFVVPLLSTLIAVVASFWDCAYEPLDKFEIW